jgi:hypothetical protein
MIETNDKYYYLQDNIYLFQFNLRNFSGWNFI